LKRQIRGEKIVNFAGFSQEFLGQIFVEKQTRKQKRNIPDKNIGRMPNSGQERKTKVHSTQFCRQLYLFRATRKTNKALPKRLASKPPFSAAISSRKQRRIKLLSLHRSVVLLCSLQGKIVLDQRFNPLSVKSKHSHVFVYD